MAAPKKRGRPHLGPRDVVFTRLLLAVCDAVDAAAAEHGIDRSPYLADVIAEHVGRPDLMRWLDQGLLPLGAPGRNMQGGEDFRGGHVTVRLPVPVRQAVDAAAAAHGIDRSTYLADVIAAHVGRPDLMRRLGQEAMPLAM